MTDLNATRFKPFEILLAEDNPGDARLTLEGFKDARVRNIITAAEDGAAALLGDQRAGAALARGTGFAGYRTWRSG